MTCIGTFIATSDGFEGRLQTLSIDRKLSIVPAETHEAGNAPDYRIMAGDGDTAFEVGAGWNRVGDKAGAYVAVLIDGGPLIFRADHDRNWTGERLKRGEPVPTFTRPMMVQPFLSSIQTAINVMGMWPHFTMMIQGLLVLVAVLLDTAKNSIRRRYL